MQSTLKSIYQYGIQNHNVYKGANIGPQYPCVCVCVCTGALTPPVILWATKYHTASFSSGFMFQLVCMGAPHHTKTLAPLLAARQ